MLNILVTGGEGFIGGHLVARLVKMEHQVTVVDDLSGFTPPQKHNVIIGRRIQD